MPLVEYLRHDLGAPQDLILSILARGRLATISAASVCARVDGWMALGFSKEDICDMLRKYSNFLRVSPLSPRVQAKLAFMEDRSEGLGMERRALVSHPQYLSYSLTDRVGPRAEATLRLTGRRIRLGDLGSSDASFCCRLAVDQEVLNDFIRQWRRSAVG